jgi:uncharacterized BrkB/YihY/UPF0761 family membrane protein
MGFLEFLIMTVVTVALATVAVWLLGHFLPGHPPIVDTVIWGVAVLIIVVMLVRAMGLMSYDPQIPQVK